MLHRPGNPDALTQQMIDIVSQGGKIYGILLYPTTYDERIETAVTIKEKTGKSGFVMPTRDRIGGWFFLNLAWSYGTEFMTQGDDGKWTAHLNSAECVAALQYLKDFKWKYDVLPENDLIGIDDIFKLVGTDQAAMSFGMDAHKDSPCRTMTRARITFPWARLWKALRAAARSSAAQQGRCGPQEQHSVDFRSIHTFMKQYPIKRTVTRIPLSGRQILGTPAMLLLNAFPAPFIFCPENHCPFRGFSS